MEVFIGQWIKVSGEVADVYKRNFPVSAAVFFFNPNVQLFFLEEKAMNHALTLQKGDRISVIGQITGETTATFMNLNNCEFLK